MLFEHSSKTLLSLAVLRQESSRPRLAVRRPHRLTLRHREAVLPGGAAKTRAFPPAEHTATFAIGALGYGCIEILWRGHTHWTMLLCGGVALLVLRRISRTALPFLTQCALGSASITGLELSAGLVVNRALHWGVWDYSAYWGNVLGQVCPLYSTLWFLLCIPVLGVLRRVWQ